MLSSGSTITMTFNFAKAATPTMGVPVEPDGYAYSTFSPPPALPTPTVTKKANPTASPTATPRRNRGSRPGPFRDN